MGHKLTLLKARHGDAFIFECKKDERSFIIVIDSGPKLCIKDIVPKIKQLSQIDLLVLTHYDEDHITGFIEYFKQYPEDALKIKEYWCNCANDIEVNKSTTISAYNNAKSFADCLRNILKDHPNIKWIELIKAGYKYHNDFVDIEILAPSESALRLNRAQYIKELYPAISHVNMEKSLSIPLEVLAKKETPSNSQVVNNSSIAFILRVEETSYLMLGDVMAGDIYNYLIFKNYSEEKPLVVDYVKVAHHGSKYNISNELLDIIRCDNYIISTNGGIGHSYHPDRETIAKILYHPRRNKKLPVHLYFNYTLQEIGKRTSFLNEGELETANCIIHENELEL